MRPSSERTGWNTCSCQQLSWYHTSISNGSVPKSMKSTRAVMDIRVSSSFNKIVWGLNNLEWFGIIKNNLEELGFGCCLSCTWKEQIHFVLSWTTLALRVRLSDKDEKFSLVTVVLLLKLLLSLDKVLRLFLFTVFHFR